MDAWVHILLCPACANDKGECLGDPCDVDHPAWGSIAGRMDAKLIEKYERLLQDRGWPGSNEAARRAIYALLHALEGVPASPD